MKKSSFVFSNDNSITLKKCEAITDNKTSAHKRCASQKENV